MFASHDSKVVYRSGSILGYPADFRYTEVVKHQVRRKGSHSSNEACRRLLRSTFESKIRAVVVVVVVVLTLTL